MKKILFILGMGSLIACQKEAPIQQEQAQESLMTNVAAGVLYHPLNEKVPEHFKPNSIAGKYKGKIRVELELCRIPLTCKEDATLVPFTPHRIYRMPSLEKAPATHDGENVFFEIKALENSNDILTIVPIGEELKIPFIYPYNSRMEEMCYADLFIYNKNYPVFIYPNGKINSANYATPMPTIQASVKIDERVKEEEEKALAAIHAKWDAKLEKVSPERYKEKKKDYDFYRNQEIRELNDNRIRSFSNSPIASSVEGKLIPRINKPNSKEIDHYLAYFTIMIRTEAQGRITNNYPNHRYVIKFEGERIYE